MDVAEAHLVQVGYRAVSLEKVAREVGLTKPSLYYHFPDGKEQLVVAIIHRSLRRLHAELEHATATGESGADKLRAIAHRLLAEPGRGQAIRELHDVTRFVAGRHHAGLAEEFYRAVHQPIRSAIASGIVSGEFRVADPDFLVWSFLGLVAGLIDVGHLPSEPPVPLADASGGELADRMVDLFLQGALPR